MSQSSDIQTFSTTGSSELGTALRNGRVLAIILVCLAIVFIHGYIQRANQAAELRAQILQMEQNIEAARLRTAALEAEFRYASSDVYLDRIAREELGLAKPGETALIVIEMPAEQAAGATAPQLQDPAASSVDELTTPAQSAVPQTDAARPLWRTWFDLFFTAPVLGN